MKKEYIKPYLQVIEVENEDIICGSGGNDETILQSSNTEDVPTSSETIWGKGIFGE